MDIQGLLISIFGVRSWNFKSRKLPVENPIIFKLLLNTLVLLTEIAAILRFLMNRLKIIFYFSLILVFLSVVTQNNGAAELNVNLEQLFGLYNDIIEEAKSGKADMAISTLNEIISMDPKALNEQGIPIENAMVNKFMALYMRGLIRLSIQGFYNEAIRDFNAAAEMNGVMQSQNPVGTLIRCYRSDAFYMAGNYNKAIDDVTKSIALWEGSENNSATTPLLSALYSVRGKYHSAQSQTQRALKDFRKAIELGSTSDFTFWGYAYELDKIKQGETARFFFNKARLTASAADTEYLGKPISLKTKAFISIRILSASKYIAISEDLASTALLYSKAYVSETKGRELTSRIQNLLKILGYDPGHIDGQIGPNTRSAIREYQKDYSIPVDGEPTEELYSRLKITIAGIAGPSSRRSHNETSQGDLSIPNLVQRAMPAIVTVICYGPDGKPDKMGSGFFVDRSLIVTNFHVINGTRLIKVKTHDGGFHSAILSCEDRYRDLALIRVGDKYKSKRQLPVSKRPPEIGERIVAIGNPLGLEQTVSDGIISAIREVKKGLDLIQITAPISPGSSGGPVLNLRGEVIGVSTLFLEKGQSLNFAVSGKYIGGMLKKRK